MTQTTEYDSKNSPYLLNRIISSETRICRYMDFDSFIQILNGYFYVPRKKLFLDARESGTIPLKKEFIISCVSRNYAKTQEFAAKKQERRTVKSLSPFT